MDKKLEEDIKAVVSAIFSEKEEAAQMQATQDALNKSAETIDALTTSLEAKASEMESIVASLNETISTKDAELASITSQLEAAKKELETTKASLASVEDTLVNIKKDQVAEVRMSELKEAKVAMLSDLSTQASKVREMSDEEFAGYKSERISLRESIMAELEANQTSTKETPATETPAAGLEGAKVIVTPPANITPGQAIAAAMNFENKPSDDMVKKYSELGKALAETIKSDKNKNQ